MISQETSRGNVLMHKGNENEIEDALQAHHFQNGMSKFQDNAHSRFCGTISKVNRNNGLFLPPACFFAFVIYLFYSPL